MADVEFPFIQTALVADAPNGQPAVSVHVKRTYKILPNGRCVRADEQKDLLAGQPMADGNPVPETDVVPFKRATDLIVLASAHAPRKGMTEMRASIHVGKTAVEYAVFGLRRCFYRGKGNIAFSQPEPFDSIPLRFENAYGGVDEAVPDPPVKTINDLLTIHPGMYPRNPAGRGYLVQESKDAIEALLLPNVECPADLLTPARLVTGAAAHWWKQPLPWSCDWFDKTWYPRVSFFGGAARRHSRR